MAFPRAALVAVVGILVLGTSLASRADSARESAGAGAASAASVPLPDGLLSGLAQHASRYEDMKRRGAFTMSGRMEELDGSGIASETKEILLRSTPTPVPLDRITQVIRFLDNGQDKTAEAQKRVSERRAKLLKDPEKRAEDRRRDIKLPFLPAEQPRYVFSLAERDAAQPHRVRVAFSPKVPAEDAIKGSAWVDERDREVLTIGFSLSKNPAFVDHVDITIVFGMATPLGRAPSQLNFDGRGGFLFIRKHYRGAATLSDPRLAF